MRYQGALLSALASIAFASDDATADNPLAVPDALPLDDLRDIPVPTYSVATGTSQDIPYATSAAIAEVAAQVAATPLSVFPAATDVPINAAGTTDSDEAGGDEGNPNVIVNSGFISKREVSGVSRQPRKRGACSPQPTIANFYNVDLSTAAAFKADAIIASVASGASTPTGYYQNFKNLGAANSAMNYLGYTVVDTGKGYDVDYCAAKCDAKAGCLSFNIYFERDPTVEPAASCPNPDAFANIKCSFWGTGLDATTANNKGQWRNRFEVAIAGSNAYTSYKLGGPLDGWNGPQKLDDAALNAPLWDCTDTWTYLGYKLLQTGSVDPRLCAAACDAQTAYNKQHPSGPNAVPCNAFGSYILNKSNSTGTYQQGQMCTFYTAYWDAKYAKNTGDFDGAVGATYKFTYSTFYGKKDVQPTCGSDYVSSSGTYIKGGDAKRGSTNEAKKVITASSLQPFCSTLLGYITQTETSTATSIVKPLTTLEVVATTTYVAEETTATVTVSPNEKRQAIETDGYISINTADYPNHLLPTESAAIVKRDATSTPGALARFPATILSSACSLAVSSPTQTSTTTTTLTTSDPVSTFITTVSTISIPSTSTSTLTVTASPSPSSPSSTICPAIASPIPASLALKTSACECTYTASCGSLENQDGSCYYSIGSQGTYGECATQCDFFANCYQFHWNGAGDKDCVLCAENGHRADAGVQGFASGTRTSCAVDMGCEVRS
ncbi:hypothetical protein Q7P35_003666 [Cladosporium inversicolor]